MQVRAVIPILALLISASSAAAAPSPKPGASCSTQGVTKIFKAKKYTCIKRANKLVWNNGVKVEPKKQAAPIPSSTPIQTPTPTPTPTPTAKPEPTTVAPTPTPSPSPTKTPPKLTAGVQAALDNLSQFPKSKVAPQQINFHFGPNADKDLSDLIVKNAKSTMEFFVDFHQEAKPYPVFYGSNEDIDWLIAEWSKYGYTAAALGSEKFEASIRNIRNRSVPPNFSIGSDNRLPQTPMIWIGAKSAIFAGDWLLASVARQINVNHHIVHGVQGRITGYKDLNLGCWGREGAANFYGWVVMDRNFSKLGDTTLGDVTYMSYRSNQIQPVRGWTAPNLNLLELSESQWLETLKGLEGNRFGNEIYCDLSKDNLAYSTGALLYERLVGEFGHQRVMDWWYEIRTTPDWKDAFEKVFKVKIDDWYKQSAIPYLIREYRDWVAIPTG